MIFTGTVISGQKRGRELGFPTANVVIDANVAPGVWVGWVSFCHSSPLANGNPGFTSAIYIHPDKKLLEAHLLDFEGDLYGEEIQVELGEKIRDPKKFDSVEALKEQIARDVENVRELTKGVKSRR